MGHTHCTQPQHLYSTAIALLPLWTIRPVYILSACTVLLYLYSFYWPYGLYTASVPVQYSYTSTPPMDHTACTELQCLYCTAISLLPLWAIRPVQSFSACKVHLYLYSLYVPYRLYTASVPVQYGYNSTPTVGHMAFIQPQCLYNTAIPLLSLLAIWPVESVSACTVQLYLYSPYGPYGLFRDSVPVQYSYTSTPPIGHTACTEPQSLYSTFIPLLPLLTIQPVQIPLPVQYSYNSTPRIGHTASTDPQCCTVHLYLYSPYWPYGLYRASMPVQYSYTSTPHPQTKKTCMSPFFHISCCNRTQFQLILMKRPHCNQISKLHVVYINSKEDAVLGLTLLRYLGVYVTPSPL